jgi:hypothetical protein
MNEKDTRLAYSMWIAPKDEPMELKYDPLAMDDDPCLPVRSPSALPDDLNPGIRKLVTALNEAGFNTTDSGDGETHDHACDRPYGYVVIISEPAKLVSESDRLKEVLDTLGLTVVPQAMEPPPEGLCTVQAMYCPADGFAIIDLSHVHDRMLR